MNISNVPSENPLSEQLLEILYNKKKEILHLQAQ